MECASVGEVVQKTFGEQGPPRGRLFVVCITQEHIMVVLDEREHPDPDFQTYTNVMVPTICGRCGGRPGSQMGTRGGFEISDDILRRTAAFRAITQWCDSHVEVVRYVEDRDEIMRQCKSYGVRLQGAEVVSVDELVILPFFDPKFA